MRIRSYLFILILCSSWLILAQTRGINIEPVTSRPTPYLQGVYRALVIGNDHYRDKRKRWTKLNTAISDAKAVARVLKDQYGFANVDLLLNATRKNILDSLEVLAKKVQTNDSVLVFYAGHGFLDPDTEKGYWIPVDANGMDKSSFIRNSTIRDELSVIANRVQHTLLISDSCFSGSLLRSGMRGLVPDTGQEHYYKKVAQKKSVQIIAAGGMEFVDDNYKNSGHSPFTYFLLNELKLNNRPLVTASELSATVKKAVANNVEQVPATGVLQGVGDELGEFIFLNINVEVDVQGIPKDKIKVKVNVTPAKGKSKPKIEKDVQIQSGDESIYIPLPGF